MLFRSGLERDRVEIQSRRRAAGEGEEIAVGEGFFYRAGDHGAGGESDRRAVFNENILEWDEVAAFEGEAVEGDIAGGAFHEPPVFDVDEKFHAAARCGMSKKPSECLTKRVAGRGQSRGKLNNLDQWVLPQSMCE